MPRDTVIHSILPQLSLFLKDYSYVLFNMSELEPVSMMDSNLYKIPKLCSALSSSSLLSQENEVLLPVSFVKFPILSLLD